MGYRRSKVLSEHKLIDKDKSCWTYWFWCPGCKEAHAYYVKLEGAMPPGPVWTFDGNMDKPTFKPSLLCQAEKRCHLFIEKGVIRFCNDCDHELAGKTTDMVEIPDWL